MANPNAMEKSMTSLVVAEIAGGGVAVAMVLLLKPTTVNQQTTRHITGTQLAALETCDLRHPGCP
jgi:DNA-binding transcriptional regulator YdaS (Cro superfamily)